MTGLTANLLDLLEVESAERMTVPTVKVTLPGDGYALRRRRYREHHHTALRQQKLVDLLERDSACCVLGKLLLEAVEAGAIRAVLRADNLARLVLNAEDKPANGLTLQVRLIAERDEVFAEVVGVEIRFCLLELHPFRFGGELQKFGQLGFEFGLGHGSDSPWGH